MLSCGAMLTRNGPLCNSAVGLTSREGHLQRRVSSLLQNKITKNRTLCTTVSSVQREARKCSVLDSPLLTNYLHQYSRTKYIYTGDLGLKIFQTRSLSTCCVTMKDVNGFGLSSNESTSTINYEELLDNTSNSTSDKQIDKSESDSPKNKIAEKTRALTEKYTLKDIEKKYPSSKSKLHEIYNVVNHETQKTHLFFDFKRGKSPQNNWTCTVRVTWPEELTFTAVGKHKMGGAAAASLKCLHYLENQKKIKNGVPLMYDSTEFNNVINKPVTLSVKQSTLNEAKALLDTYEDNIQPLINTSLSTYKLPTPGFQEGAIIDPVGNSNPFNRSEQKIQQRNEVLRERYFHRIQNYQPIQLPISEYKDEIIQAVEENQIILIKGDTGCGKTTQVPQYIMDSFAARGEATKCNMIVSQPRRISAISLAERIASERKEQMPDVVGYQVRLSQELPNTPAGILFCTTGLLLRKLQFNPTMTGCSHVIVDEAHERTINTDMLLVLLKRTLEKNPQLKVIIMSATINADLFKNYFNCKVIEVPGRTYPVEMNFLEDINALPLELSNRWDNTFQDPEKLDGGVSIDLVKMGALISYIARNKPPGAILCFLPGWGNIVKLKWYLEEFASLSARETMIVPVHSKMSHVDQRKIFSKPPKDVRKIVLATDIAETGITVADVVYVVDCCVHKQIRWHEKLGFMSIDNHWVSQANVMQRKGRAGRVKPGISYHFITRNKFENLDPYPTPEVKRSSLEKTVLDAKTYSSEKAAVFLGAMPEPPGARVIAHAVEDLIKLGALDVDENLTPLGHRISMFTVHPKLSKAMVYSSIFQCISPMITIASVMSAESELFTGVLNDKAGVRGVKKHFHPTSDHVSLAWLFQQWKTLNDSSITESKNFAHSCKLSPERVFTLSKVREINAEHLVYAEMLSDMRLMDDFNVKENEYAELDELVRGVLLSGLDQVIYQRDFDIRKGRLKKNTHTFIMEDGNRVTITPDSVNFKRSNWPSPYLTYVRRTHSEERRTSLVRETSIISPLTIFLFNQARMFGYLYDGNSQNEKLEKKQMILFTIKGRKNVRLVCDKDTADILLNFRDSMWSVVRYLVANYGTTKTDKIDEFEHVNGYKVQMLQVLAKMLSEASESIDDPGPKKSDKPKKYQSTKDYNW